MTHPFPRPQRRVGPDVSAEVSFAWSPHCVADSFGGGNGVGLALEARLTHLPSNISNTLATQFVYSYRVQREVFTQYPALRFNGANFGRRGLQFDMRR